MSFLYAMEIFYLYCTASAVDEWCRPVLNLYIRQELPVVSYLTPLTGITKEVLDSYAVPQAEALASLRCVYPEF